MVARARVSHFIQLFFAGLLIVMGESCTPPVSQSVYYAPSTSGNRYANVPLSTPLSGLVVPLLGAMTVGSQAPIQASGGTPPYHYLVTSANGGSFNGNVYTAPSIAGLVQLEIGDAAGQSVQMTVSVTNNSVTPGTGSGGAPITFDVYTTPVCNNSYCTCGSASQPGLPNQAAAQAICTAYGYTALTAYTITDGPVNTNQCDPSTGQCYLNQNPNNIVCVTVTCQ